jgi:hypothetical protein
MTTLMMLNVVETILRQEMMKIEESKEEVGGIDPFADENLMRLSGLIG